MGATTQSFKYLAACFAPLHLWLFVILRTCASHVMDPEAFQALCCPLHGCMYKSGSCRCANDLFMCSTKLDMQPNRRNPLAGKQMAIHLALVWAFTYSCQASRVGRIWPTNLGFLQELHPVWPLPLHLAHPSCLDFLGIGCLVVAAAAPGFCIAVASQAEAAGLFMALPLPMPLPLPFPLLFLCPLEFFFNWSIACCSYSSKSRTIA